jgi:hypothetical protein
MSVHGGKAVVQWTSPERLQLMFWFALATKMVVAALFVSVATIVAERLGAMVGALVATLPVSAGPVYVFLALAFQGIRFGVGRIEC